MQTKLFVILFLKLKFVDYIQQIQASNSHPSCNQKQTSLLLEDGCYRAAVYEHDRIDGTDLKFARDENLKIYRTVIKEAAKEGAQIIVLPEDGIVMLKNRTAMEVVVEDITNLHNLTDGSNNPCLFKSSLYETNPILVSLSCSARENNIYVVANFGTIERCKPAKYNNAACPEKGRFMFNTDVVFDAEGRLIERYLKYNTFLEIFDQAPFMKRVFFDTNFGRFGLMTCFDILFEQPAIDLVKIDKIDTMLFPTWWYDELPLLSAIQFQDAWSTSLKVNLLAANILKKDLGSVGSGIFSSNGKQYTSSNSKVSKLIVKSLPIKYDITKEHKCIKKDQIIDFENGQPKLEYSHLNMKFLDTDLIFALNSFEDIKHACIREFCCKISYSVCKNCRNLSLNSLIFFVRNSLRKGAFEWYEQICGLVSIEQTLFSSSGNEDPEQQVKFLTKGLIALESVKIEATFSTGAVFPIAAHSKKLVDDYKFNCDSDNNCVLSIINSTSSDTLNVAALYGRVFNRDNMVRVPHVD